MQKEIIEKANEIISLIEDNEKAIKILNEYEQTGQKFYTNEKRYGHGYNEKIIFDEEINFEDWEIRLMIHQKKQRIQALKMQLERL